MRLLGGILQVEEVELPWLYLHLGKHAQLSRHLAVSPEPGRRFRDILLHPFNSALNN